MPLTRLQSELLRLIARNRSPESYIAGAIALNRDGPRFSGDIDIFQDGDTRLAEIAIADGRLIAGAGYTITWDAPRGAGKRSARVDGLSESTREAFKKRFGDVVRVFAILEGHV